MIPVRRRMPGASAFFPLSITFEIQDGKSILTRGTIPQEVMERIASEIPGRVVTGEVDGFTWFA
jgi:hypothetical protein